MSAAIIDLAAVRQGKRVAAPKKPVEDNVARELLLEMYTSMGVKERHALLGHAWMLLDEKDKKR